MDSNLNTYSGITAIILAGSRPGGDPLAQAMGAPVKALIPVAGQVMLAHVAQTLATHPRIARILVLAQQTDMLSGHPDMAWATTDVRIGFVTSGSGISSSLSAVLNDGKARYPVLVTTADNVLLNHAMLDSFLTGSDGADLAVAMVEQRVLLAAFPRSRRTWLKFRGGAWSGANLFWLGNGQVKPLLDLWQGVEQDRKKGMKIVGAFGPLLLLGALLRLLDIHQAVARAGRRFGLAARVVAMPQAEACIDVDKMDDLDLAERILAGQIRPHSSSTVQSGP
ncbi:MAG: NTP transferase domain-containing protein [Alphaproteobacteria bacterium]|nr:NTP transferase domain-containing protein [Alphaproteobacteria bacterium]